MNIPPGKELDRFAGFRRRFLTDEQGKPIVLEPFQREILRDFFAGPRKLVVILPKKAGKTSMFVALALWGISAFDVVGPTGDAVHVAVSVRR